MSRKLKDIIKNIPLVKMYRGYKKNIFNTSYSKNVLVSYVVYPIFMKDNKSHSNIIEVNSIVKCFKNMGYNVDIVDYDYKYNINFEKYNVIFGLGRPLESAIKYNNVSLKKILYVVGQHPYINNTSAVNRLVEFNKVKGKILYESIRLSEEVWPLQLSLSDCIIVLGNSVTKKTFENFYDGKIYTLNPPTFDIMDNIKLSKEIVIAKKSFLWFGSKGAIHKGLDLLLEVFRKREDIVLHICGSVENEKEFFELYYDEIKSRKNIIYHGFIDIESNRFNEIVNKCVYSILPSCAEGGSTSLLNCMRAGLIPITTKASGIDFDKFGFEIKDLSEKSIDEVINLAISITEEEIFNRSKACSLYVKKNYSEKSYLENLSNILLEV